MSTIAAPRVNVSGIPQAGLIFRFRAADLVPPAAGTPVNSLPDSTAVTGAAGLSFTATGGLYTPNGIGGKPALSMIGGTGYLTLAMQRGTTMFVVQPGEVGAYTDYRRLIDNAGTGNSVFGVLGNNNWNAYSFPNAEGAAYGYRRSDLRVNGNDNPSVISPLNQPQIVAFDPTTIITAAAYLFSYSTTFIQTWVGLCAEILVWNRKLSPQERQAAERTLGAYYSISTRS